MTTSKKKKARRKADREYGLGEKLSLEQLKVMSITQSKEACGYGRNIRYCAELDIFNCNCGLGEYDPIRKQFPRCNDPQVFPNWSNPGGKYAGLGCGPYKQLMRGNR